MLDVGPKMAKLIYDNDGRLLFTKEMKKEYKILMPMMLPIHFSLIRELLVLDGYDAELLTTTDHDIIDTGLKYTVRITGNRYTINHIQRFVTIQGIDTTNTHRDTSTRGSRILCNGNTRCTPLQSLV